MGPLKCVSCCRAKEGSVALKKKMRSRSGKGRREGGRENSKGGKKQEKWTRMGSLKCVCRDVGQRREV